MVKKLEHHYRHNKFNIGGNCAFCENPKAKHLQKTRGVYVCGLCITKLHYGKLRW
jgi:hypothetical protein